MTGTRPADILRRLDDPAASDRELLDRFIRERDQVAFAELVRRHGPLVLGVCKRLAGHEQDAEDAFQAVFLVLAQKSANLASPDLLGNWLYGVAVRVAQKARRAAARRRRREAVVSISPDRATSPPLPDPDLAPLIDAELAELPACYREAILLCDIQGVPRPEAARRLGVPEGTLSSRLAMGRRKLAARLLRRGVVLPAGAAVAISPAAVSAELVNRTCTLVSDWVAGETLPHTLVGLARGGISVRTTWLVGLFATVAVVAGMVCAAQPDAPPKPADPPIRKLAAAARADPPVTAPKGDEKPLAYTRSPRLTDTIDLPISLPVWAVWNPKGTILAITDIDELQLVHTGSDKLRHTAQKLGSSRLIGFTPDGLLVTELREYELLSGVHRLDYWSVQDANSDRALIRVRTVKLDPAETSGYAFAVDGKTFRTVAIERASETEEAVKREDREIKRLGVWEVDAVTGKRLRVLLSVPGAKLFKLSPDGKKLAIVEKEPTVTIYDLDRDAKLACSVSSDVKKPSDLRDVKVQESSRNQGRGALMFSPDSQRLLYSCGLTQTVGFVGKGAAGSVVLTGGAGQAIVLDTDTGKPLPPLAGATPMIADRRLGPDSFSGKGRLLAFGGDHFSLELFHQGRGGPEIAILTKQTPFLTVWDVDTGAVLKTWDRRPYVCFNPVHPLLAMLEPNGKDLTRLGFWDFSVEAAGN